MKSRRSGAGSATTPRSSNLTTMRSVVEMTSDCSCENLLEQLKYFVEKPSDNLDVIVTICSKLFLKLTSQDKTSKDKVLEKIRRGKRDFYPLFLKIIEARNYINSLPQLKKKDFKTVFKGANPQAIDLLTLMLELDSDKRITAEQALAHPYLSQYSDPNDEPTSPPYDQSFEDMELPVEKWKELVYEEVVGFKPIVTVQPATASEAS